VDSISKLGSVFDQYVKKKTDRDTNAAVSALMQAAPEERDAVLAEHAGSYVDATKMGTQKRQLTLLDQAMAREDRAVAADERTKTTNAMLSSLAGASPQERMKILAGAQDSDVNMATLLDYDRSIKQDDFAHEKFDYRKGQDSYSRQLKAVEKHNSDQALINADVGADPEANMWDLPGVSGGGTSRTQVAQEAASNLMGAAQTTDGSGTPKVATNAVDGTEGFYDSASQSNEAGDFLEPRVIIENEGAAIAPPEVPADPALQESLVQKLETQGVKSNLQTSISGFQNNYVRNKRTGNTKAMDVAKDQIAATLNQRLTSLMPPVEIAKFNTLINHRQLQDGATDEEIQAARVAIGLFDKDNGMNGGGVSKRVENLQTQLDNAKALMAKSHTAGEINTWEKSFKQMSGLKELENNFKALKANRATIAALDKKAENKQIETTAKIQKDYKESARKLSNDVYKNLPDKSLKKKAKAFITEAKRMLPALGINKGLGDAVINTVANQMFSQAEDLTMHWPTFTDAFGDATSDAEFQLSFQEKIIAEMQRLNADTGGSSFPDSYLQQMTDRTGLLKKKIEKKRATIEASALPESGTPEYENMPFGMRY
jgi:hypothetical protein